MCVSEKERESRVCVCVWQHCACLSNECMQWSVERGRESRCVCVSEKEREHRCVCVCVCVANIAHACLMNAFSGQ